MQKKVHSKVVDDRLYDGNTVIEDTMTVTLPEIAFNTDKFDIPGASAVFEHPNQSKVDAMTFAINHNNGEGSAKLMESGTHNFEFRVAQQVLDVATSTTEYEQFKFRIRGNLKKVSHGTIERDNPLGTTNEYTVTRFEMEANGKVLVLVDALTGDLRINGKDCMADIRRLLD